MVPFEEREELEGEYTTETDFTRYHQVLEEGDEFESSFLRFGKCCFLAFRRVHTHLWTF